MSTDDVQNDDGPVATMENTEPVSKMAKDKKSRKEKSKPLAKVSVFELLKDSRTSSSEKKTFTTKSA